MHACTTATIGAPTVTRVECAELTALMETLAGAERRLHLARTALAEMCPEPVSGPHTEPLAIPTVIFYALAAANADVVECLAQVQRTLQMHPSLSH